jgi:preprotein translocase subunit SecG
MPWIVSLLVVVQVICAATIIILVLLQHGKGADMGAAFGSGASGSLFGASGSANFLSRSTGIAAAVFFVATIGLAYFSNSMRVSHGGLMSNAPATSAPAPSNLAPAPALPANSSDKSADIPK